MILAVDPSIRRVGWATYNKIEWIDQDAWNHGCIEIPQGLTIPETLIKIAVALNNNALADIYPRPTQLIVEYPEFFQGSQKGATAAVQGTTFGLAAVAGFLQGYYKVPSKDTFFYRPSEWKGQVPKKGMEYRFEKLMGYWPKTEHEAEALLMIDYHLNKLVKKK